MDRTSMIDTLQACTGLEDIEECRQIMENHGWDLEAAVNSVLNVMQPPAEEVRIEPVRNVLTFDVSYRELRSKIKLEDNEKVSVLKDMIESTLNIPKNLQIVEELNGYSDFTYLRDIFHSSPISLTVRSRQEELSGNANARVLRLNFIVRNFSSIGSRVPRDRQHILQIPVDSTIQNAKDELAERCGIPAIRQIWIDYSYVPNNTLVKDILSDGDTILVHSVGGSAESTSNNVLPNDDFCNLTSDDSNDDIAIIDDSPMSDIFDVAIAKRETLLPNHCEDETVGLERFAEVFAQRYGPLMPVMFTSTLENAIDEALYCPLEDRKLLAIYIHNDRSICANVFCQQVLMNECIITFLMNHYLLWPWDFTFLSNRQRFLDKSFRLFGQHVTSMIENYDQEKFPIILVLARPRSSIENIGFIDGSESFNEVMTKLSSYVDRFEMARTEEIEIENERRHRNMIRKEQDEAYHNSLAKDKEKRLRQETELKMQQMEEQARLEAALAKEKMRKQLENELPIEPPDDADNVCIVRFRIPSGDLLSRNFLLSDPLKIIFTYVGSKGYPISEYKLLRAYPRKDISEENERTSISDAGIHCKELLTLVRR